MDYKELIEDLNKESEWYGMTDESAYLLMRQASTAITELLNRVEEAETISSELCDDFIDFVTGGVYNAAPYCANMRKECVNAYGICDGNNEVCKGFLPKAVILKEE